MKLRFVKMEGCGNDYVYIDCFRQRVENPRQLARSIADRHFGVGGDGLILIEPSTIADGRMRMFNADGSEGWMCGNGVRCVGKYLYDSGITKNRQVLVETRSGVKSLAVTAQNGNAETLQVEMGAPLLLPGDIPVLLDGESIILHPVCVGGQEFEITCVSMGNPHCVIFVDDTEALELDKIGPLFERHALFPKGINTEFVQVKGRDILRMRVWERGSGETLACGTGACAAVVAAVLCGHCQQNTDIIVQLRGGELSIRWKENGGVLMTGPARRIFEGTWDIETAEPQG